MTAALRPRGAFKRRLFIFLLCLVMLGAGQMAAYALAGDGLPANGAGTTGQHGQQCPPSNHDTTGGTCEHNGGGGGNCGDNQGIGSAGNDNGFGRVGICSQVSQTTTSTTDTDPTTTTPPTTTGPQCTRAHPCPNPGCEPAHGPGDCFNTTPQETTTTRTTTPSQPPSPPPAGPTPSTTTSTATASTAPTTTTAPFTPPAIVCATRLAVSTTRFVVGKRSILVVRVRNSDGTPVDGVTVHVQGAGINLQAKTDSAGIARFSLRPKSAGMVRISLAQPAACNAVSRLARAVGIFKPPKPNFTGR